MMRSRLQGIARRRVPTMTTRRTFLDMTKSECDFGSHCFKGAVAEKYLSKQGLSAAVLEDPSWTTTHADEVANAVMEWARDAGASNITHWWQPMGASGVRPGSTGQVSETLRV